MKYTQAATLTVSTGQERKDKLIARALLISEQDDKSPNISAVVNELVDIGFVALDLFGEEWRDQLKVQSKPKWAEKFEINQLKMLEIIQNIGSVSIEQQDKKIAEIRNDMDVDGMLE